MKQSAHRSEKGEVISMTGDPGSEASRDALAEVTSHDVDRILTPPGATEVFGEMLPIAERYVALLSTAGMERGLMGPRERARMWDRHVLNSAAARSGMGEGESVVDIGSGAGLPGIPLALARPDLRVTLVEPLLRRVRFLEEVIEELGINVRVLRGRAEEATTITEAGGADVVTSRAVAPLAKLGGWSAPLLRSGGRMVALKGESAAEEIERDAAALSRLGFNRAVVDVVEAPDAEATRLVSAVLPTAVSGRKAGRSSGRRGRRAR